MSGYPEYYTIVYRDDQRVMILEENPEKRLAPPKRGIRLKQKEISTSVLHGVPADNSRLSQTNLNSSNFWFPKVKG